MNNYPKFANTKVNFLLDHGGLGDQIARLPAIKYIKDRHPHVEPIVWIPDYFIPLARNVLPEIDFRPFSEGATDYDEKLPCRSTGARWFTNLKTSMVDHAFALLANEIPSIEYKNYLKVNTNSISIAKWNLPKKYIVVTCGFTAPIREFLPEYINEITQYIRTQTDYQIVFLGKETIETGIKDDIIKGTFKTEINFSKGINLVNKTSLLEAAKIMNNSKLVLGLDNGLLHLAAMTDIQILGGFTSVDPIHRLPIRNNIFGKDYHLVVPSDSEPEKFCQSRWDFCFEHDFRFSYYGTDDLIKSLKPELWIEKLKEIL